MNKISLSLSLVMLFLVSFSCTDHDIPLVRPSLETENVNRGKTATSDGLYFGVKWLDLGNSVSIVEFGNVYSKTVSGEALKLGEPGVEKIVSPIAPVLGNVYFAKFFVVDSDYYYRGYAKLGDGSVIYGTAKKFSL